MSSCVCLYICNGNRMFIRFSETSVVLKTATLTNCTSAMLIFQRPNTLDCLLLPYLLGDKEKRHSKQKEQRCRSGKLLNFNIPAQTLFSLQNRLMPLSRCRLSLSRLYCLHLILSYHIVMLCSCFFFFFTCLWILWGSDWHSCMYNLSLQLVLTQLVSPQWMDRQKDKQMNSSFHYQFHIIHRFTSVPYHVSHFLNSGLILIAKPEIAECYPLK